MAKVHRAKTADEYVDLVKQALFEIEELRVAAEYDMEDMGTSLKFVGDLEDGMRTLYKSMQDGSYKFANRDLPFMEIVDLYDDRKLPFRYLLRVINETHRMGLDVGED